MMRSTTAFFRLLLVTSIVCDLAAWTWRDIALTRALDPDRVKGDAELMITALLFVVFAVPLWRLWRWSGPFMAALTVLAIVGRLAQPMNVYGTNDGIMLLEIIAATCWGAMIAIVYSAEGRRLFTRRLI
ncbi:MAG: hypothetical protein MRY74_06260 [Neomegalonema sp.]|nr:hypothetical protein [Neomegalonema sp.]